MKTSLCITTFYCLLAASAAQSAEVTIYGVADTGMQFVDTKEGGSKFGMVSGGRNGSRLGLRGTEDLGNGLNAIFMLEQGINYDTGRLGQGGRMWGRQAFMGLRGNFGTLALGRVATFSSGSGAFDMFGDLDPFLTSFGIAGLGSTMSSASGLRTDNSILYMTPNWNGFRFGAAHSFEFDGEQDFGSHGKDNHVTSFGVQYTSGPFNTALTLDTLNDPSGGSDEQHYQLGASYDFDVIKLYAALGYERNQFSPDFNITGTTNGADARSWMAGLSAPWGSGTIRLSYQRRNGQRIGADKRDVNVASIGYEYNLSKRTMLYAAIANSDGRNTLNGDPDFDRRVYTAGVAHRF